jgi:endonuclease III
MKNATKHADELKSFAKKVMKDYKPATGASEPQEPLQALVRAAMSYDVSDARAEEAMRAIEQEFVDLNEFRVATDLEIQGLLGNRYPGIEHRVGMVTMALNNIFEREHTLSLNRLKEVSKRDARQFLRDLPEVHPFVEAYVMLTAFDGTAMPVDDMILDLLKEHGIIEPETTLVEAQKFLENNLKAEEIPPFFHAVRAAALEAGKRKKAKA